VRECVLSCGPQDFGWPETRNVKAMSGCVILLFSSCVDLFVRLACKPFLFACVGVCVYFFFAFRGFTESANSVCAYPIDCRAFINSSKCEKKNERVGKKKVCNLSSFSVFKTCRRPCFVCTQWDLGYHFFEG